MEFRVLGPLEVRVHDRPLALGGTRPRVVLAALLLERNTVVPVERLVSAIWGDEPPGTPTAQVQAAVSALRKTFDAAGEPDRIRTRAPGYLIRTERGELDLAEFDREVAAARRKGQQGDPGGAADGLRAALEWWRDDALVDLAQLPIRTATVAVDERRWVAWEERIEADLALRRHADLLPELSALVTKKPLRDRLWTQLIRAQYRCGRRAEALETYQQARRVMLDELGLEPAAELIAVHRAILADDPALDPDVLPVGPAPDWVRPPCPYRALIAYQPGDRAAFFGREAETAAVLRRARTGPVTVVGPSGCGKSSLLLAGVQPALTGCTTLLVRPSDQGRIDLALAAAVARTLPDEPVVPELVERIAGGGLAELVTQILTHTGTERLVVVLDQAEELLAQDPAVVDPTVGALFTAAPDRLTVLATLRADFLGAVLERPALAGTLGGPGVFTLAAMSRDQLREAITAPIAQLSRVSFQPGLVDRILDDVGAEPGALALLGLTLTLLWDEQQDGTLTHQAYDELGRVPGALAGHAESEWRRRNLADREPLLRQLVGRLVQVQPGGQITRRVAGRAELDGPAWALAERLASTRLLVLTGDGTGEPTVELAHEALLGYWPRLRGWVERDLDFHLWRSGLRADVERYRRAGEDPALLARGPVLVDAQRWRTEHGDQLGADELAFIGRSERAHRTTGRRSRLLRSGLAAAAALLLVLGLVLVQQRTRTAGATAEADSRALAADSEATADSRPERAAALAVAAYDRAPTAEAGAALFGRAQSLGNLDALYSADEIQPGIAATSTDARVVAAVHKGLREVTIWVRDPGRPVRVLRPQLPSSRIAVAADGKSVWLLAADGIGRLDVDSEQIRTVARVGWSQAPFLTLSPDGTRILLTDQTDTGERRYRVREFGTADGRELGGASFPSPGPAGYATVWPTPTPGLAVIEFRTVRGAGYRAEELDLRSGARSALADAPAGGLASDHASVVTCAPAGDSYLFSGVRVADRTPIGSTAVPAGVQNPPISCPLFTAGPAGRVVTGTDYTRMSMVELSTGETARVNAFAANGLLPTPTRITPDGSRLLVTGDSWVGLVDLTRPENLTPMLQGGMVLADGRALVGVSVDGRRLAVRPITAGGPAATVDRPTPYRAADDEVGLVLGRDLVADRVAEDRLAIYRLPALQPLGTVTVPPGQLQRAFFDLDARLVTVLDQQVYWWDSRTGERRQHLDLGRPGADPGLAVAANRDPNLIAVSSPDRPAVSLRAVDDGREVDTIPVGAGVREMSFQAGSDDVLISRDTTLEMWDGRAKRMVLGPVPAGSQDSWLAAMDRVQAGRAVVFGFAGGRWLLRTYRVGVDGPETALDIGSQAPVSWTPDLGVITVGEPFGSTVGVRRLDPAGWRADLCATLAGQEFTADDRAAFPALPPGPVCAAPGLTR